ncbi:MAG: histidine kinase [Cyclobacteriaceae bacterium]|nr:histidine kinase [Cyclobacteriaceae bacterium]
MPEPEQSERETEKRITHSEIKLDDNTFRWIGIPFFGLLIPNTTGLFGTLTFTDLSYWLGYLYFISLAYLIWQGNRYLLFRTRKRFTWFDKPVEKLVLLLMNNIFYTAPLTIAWLCLWYIWAGFPKTDWSTIQMVVLINVICVLFVTHVYETVFLVKEKESETVKNEQLQRARAEAELTALKNQVDPHFMFNSLNTLSYLIKSDREKAHLFTENLAEVYRYILIQKDHTLVLLEDELEFTHRYTDLLHLRFGKALIIKKQFNGSAEKDYLIPPTSVFVAFENAVKHNEISEQKPLHIDVDVQNNQLTIINQIQEKGNKQNSSQIGLKNLTERFQLITGNPIKAYKENGKFIVSLPLTPLNSHENNNN